MPFTGPSGLLVDYSSFITDRPVYDNLVTVRVLAREGTPASITEALSEAGLSVGTTLGAGAAACSTRARTPSPCGSTASSPRWCW